MTVRIDRGQRTSGEKGRGEEGAENGSQGISAKTTSSEKKRTWGYSPPKSIPANRRNVTIHGIRKKYH